MRSLWTGSLSFGLINIPVKLYSASEERALSFKLFDKHGNCPVSYIKVCRDNHKEIPQEDIVKGYEYQKGDYIILDESDFKKAAPKKTDLIDIVQFSDEEDIESKYYEKPYYIEPDKKAGKAYLLLRDALEKSKKVAIARFVMRDKEHIAAIKPDGDVLVLNQLRFRDEIKDTKDLAIPKSANYSDGEFSVATTLIKQLTSKFDPKKFKDTYVDELKEVIEAKAKGKKVKAPAHQKERTDTQMKDLMKLLKKSLEKETVRG
ncbi:MAG: hypothetical protein JWN37_642 [Candidatus Nomurabacteria bacterium]|nr:hypothetical protein [Candidatus Nomurabacteria bacterium]